jgi:hypothetical protein
MGESIIGAFRIRTCLNCGCWFGVNRFLCASCFDVLMESFGGPRIDLHGQFCAQSLLHWRPGESDMISALAYQMKTEGLEGWRFWAEVFVRQMRTTHQRAPFKTENLILTSSESLTGNLHAQNWGSALSCVLGVEHRCLLRPIKSSILQKKVGIPGRKLRAFECLEEISFSKNQRVIFVDDIVTTGYTALAAYKALGQPRRFEVWSLLYREEKTS